MTKELNCGWILLDMCIWISLLNSVCYHSLIYSSPSSPDFSSLDRNPVSIEMIFPLQASAIIFVFSEFSAHDMKWLHSNIRVLFHSPHFESFSGSISQTNIRFPYTFPYSFWGIDIFTWSDVYLQLENVVLSKYVLFEKEITL